MATTMYKKVFLLREAVILFVLLIPTLKADEPLWSYLGPTGQSHWQKLGQNYSWTCNANSQSPIDIVGSNSEYVKLDKFKFTYNSDEGKAKLRIKNNGHTVQADVLWDVTVEGGGLPGKYKVQQFHFHFGKQTHRGTGSEHSLQGLSFPLEVHIVTAKEDLLSESAEKFNANPEARAVLGILFRESETDNPLFDEIIKPLGRAENGVTYQGDSVEIPVPFTIEKLLPFNPTDFFRYNGSLTTPPCTENVIWTVFLHTQHISRQQLEAFQKLKSGTKGEPDSFLAPNFRDIQPMNGRTVIRSFPHFSVSMIVGSSTQVSASLLVVSILTITSLLRGILF